MAQIYDMQTISTFGIFVTSPMSITKSNKIFQICCIQKCFDLESQNGHVTKWDTILWKNPYIHTEYKCIACTLLVAEIINIESGGRLVNVNCKLSDIYFYTNRHIIPKGHEIISEKL